MEKELKLNLQLFSEEDVVDDLEVEDVVEVDEAEVDVDEPKKSESVPLNKFLEEKKRRKEMERKLRELEGSSKSHEEKSKIEKIMKLAKDKGYDDDLADLFGQFASEVLASIPKSESEDKALLEEIEDLASVDPDVLKYKKEVIAKIKKFEKAGEELTVEEALELVRPKKLTRELKTEIEQRQAVERRKVQDKKVANNAGGKTKESFPLNDEQKKVLEGLQKAQPDKGWTAEKLYKRINENK